MLLPEWYSDILLPLKIFITIFFEHTKTLLLQKLLHCAALQHQDAPVVTTVLQQHPTVPQEAVTFLDATVMENVELGNYVQ